MKAMKVDQAFSRLRILQLYILNRIRIRILDHFLVLTLFRKTIQALRLSQFFLYFSASYFILICYDQLNNPNISCSSLFFSIFYELLFVLLVTSSIQIYLYAKRRLFLSKTKWSASFFDPILLGGIVLFAITSCIELIIEDGAHFFSVMSFFEIGSLWEFLFLLSFVMTLHLTIVFFPLLRARLLHVPMLTIIICLWMFLRLFETDHYNAFIVDLSFYSEVDVISVFVVTVLIAGVFQAKKSIRYLSSRIVVNAFETHSEDKKDDLHALSALFTQSLITELHFIAEMASLNRIESADIIRMDSDQINAKPIIAGSLENLSLDKMASITSVDLSFANLSVPVPYSFFKWLLKYFCNFQISGTIIRRFDNSYEVYVEDQGKKFNRPILIQETIVPKFSTHALTEREICSSAKMIALKLAFAMGVGNPFFTEVEGLSEYLLGLKASADKKWWLAISHYRRCIEIEETSQGEFGIGHYLLGSALVSQGNSEKGLVQLRMAESQGPQLPELYYMLALTILSHNYYRLPDKDDEFSEIQNYCKKSIMMRPRFIETYHLLAILFYLRGRLKERKKTKTYWQRDEKSSISTTRQVNAKMTSPTKSDDYLRDYRTSHFFYTKTTALYWHKMLESTIKRNFNVFTQSPKAIFTDTLLVCHQQADALRGLKLYSEAKILYGEVLHAMPKNLRTLVDLAKTLCLNEEWEQAVTLVEEKIFTMDEGRWDANANFYLGWAYAGLVKGKSLNETQQRRFLSSSLTYLDYALHQRPRYMLRWSQNDWLPTYTEACHIVANTTELGNPPSDSELGIMSLSNRKFAELSFWWLGWRHKSFDFTKEDLVSNGDRQLSENFFWGKDSGMAFDGKAWQGIWAYHITLADSIDFLINQSVLDDRKVDLPTLSGHHSKEIEMRGLEHSWQFAKSSKNIISDWKKFDQKFDSLEADGIIAKPIPDLDMFDRKSGLPNNEPDRPLNHRFTLVERLFIDLYAEFSCLTSLILASAQDYSSLYQVSIVASEKLKYWTENWSTKFDDRLDGRIVKKGFRFSPMIIRYQLASLSSWAAFGLLNFQQGPDPFYPDSTSPKKNKRWQELRAKDSLKRILALVQAAIKIKAMHPLAMAVYAEVLRLQKQYSPAIVELERLLSKIDPIDPSRTIVRQGIRNKKKNAHFSLRERLYKQEQLIGSRRFENFVNPFQICLQLSKIYEDKGKPEQCVAQMARAISVTNSRQASTQNFLILANRLKNLNRFREAFAVLDAIFISLKGGRIEDSLSLFSGHAVTILRASLYNRQGENGKSLMLGKTIARKYVPTRFDISWENLVTKTIKADSEDFFDKNGYSFFTQLFAGKDETKSLAAPSYWSDAVYKKFLSSADYHCNKLISYSRRIKKNHIDGAKTLDSSNDKLLDNEPNRDPEDSEDRPSCRIPLTDIFDEKIDLLPLLNQAWPWILLYSSDSIVVKFLNYAYSSKLVSSLDDTKRLWLHNYFLAIGESSLEELIRLADLCNALAYSRAELDLRLDLAEQDSKFSLTILHFIYLNLQKKIEHGLIHRVRGKIAQSYDTLSWIYFRRSNRTTQKRPKKRKEFLYDAQAAAELALRYDQQTGVIYYHVARIHLTQVEEAWQGMTFKSDKRIANVSPIIDKHLRLAFRNWSSAQQLPKSDRLHIQLVWLGKKLNVYQERWDKIQATRYLSRNKSLPKH